MAKRDEGMPVLKKGTKVVLRRDLRQVEEGTEGKVVLVVGLDWVRYWVSFDNGVAVGSVNRADLATPEEWKRHLAGEDDTAAGDADGGGDDGAAGGESDGRGYEYNGVVVPQILIDRSRAARERLGA